MKRSSLRGPQAPIYHDYVVQLSEMEGPTLILWGSRMPSYSRPVYFPIIGREFGTLAPYPAGASSIGSFGAPPMAR